MAKISIHDVLAHFREAASSNRDLGDRFERLICRYLELDPIYAGRFSNVWMWNEWPRKGNVGDVGIDIVAEERATGEFCGIQCKFFLPEHTVSKEDIDSYFTALGNPLFTSGLIVSTTDRWGKNAEHAIEHQTKPVNRLTVHDLDASPIDWSRFSLQRPQDLSLRPQKKPRDDQKTAIADVFKGFAQADRGKLIMACGTGKTFTALKIAEKIAPSGHVLFLVPSLSLMSQTLREWTAESVRPIHSLAVCSDSHIGKRTAKTDDDKGDITTCDLAFPATTSARQIVGQYQAVQRMAERRKSAAQMTVVFSTYQSIQAVSDAQKAGLPDFDIIICDEAHRTTGVTLSGEDESHFVKVHDANFIKAKKRLYMTATPRVYGDEAKMKAGQADAELCSMDDAALFGEEFHRLGFGEAVSKSLLSDYKVLVLAVDEKYVDKAFQRLIADRNNEIDTPDAVKIVGCWNGLAKRFDQATASAADLQDDVLHMRRAVAFSRSIKDSKAFVEKFGQIIAAYRETHPDAENLLHCELDHVDGTFDALERNARLDWLKAVAPENTCRILSNARCLSEGVDVPALDAVLFLNPRKSIIDVVQSVGRVMRRAEGKKYGYIILPIGIPADVPAEEALKDNEKYKVVWQVLPNASHDWINQRDPAFGTFTDLGEKQAEGITVFENYSSGVITNRDYWCYNFSRNAVEFHMRRMIEYFNAQVKAFKAVRAGKAKDEILELVEGFIDNDPKKISWTREIKQDLGKGRSGEFRQPGMRSSMYRPFTKEHLYFDSQFNNCVYQLPQIFPRVGVENLVIVVSGIGAAKDFSTLIADCIPNRHMHDTGQCYPLYLYEKDEPQEGELIRHAAAGELVCGYRRRSAITDAILADFRAAYEAGSAPAPGAVSRALAGNTRASEQPNASDSSTRPELPTGASATAAGAAALPKQITKEDIFYYVYGVLHSPEYRTRFASDLKKMLPRLPFTRETADFWRLSQAGRDLAQWHLNYETVEPWPVPEFASELPLGRSAEHRSALGQNETRAEQCPALPSVEDFLVQKMTFGRAGRVAPRTPSDESPGCAPGVTRPASSGLDKSVIHYNARITLTGIPLEAYDYVVNGKPALEWIMERYQITVDKDSGIRNDPNDWAREHHQPRYILDLLKRIVRVSLETMKIVNALPALNERK